MAGAITGALGGADGVPADWAAEIAEASKTDLERPGRVMASAVASRGRPAQAATARVDWRVDATEALRSEDCCAMRLTWVQPEDLLPHQLVQSRSEGVDVTDVQARWLAAGGTTDAPASGASDEPATPELRALARELLDELDARTAALARAGDPRPAVARSSRCDRRAADAATRWLGRAAGNLLGKPVEKIPREGIREILETSGQWPLTQYITAVGVPEEVQRRWPWNRRSKPTSLREVIDGMPEDDDLNFAILALQLLERHGRGLTTEDVAQAWLNDLPAGRVFTAERVAYRNLLDGVDPRGPPGRQPVPRVDRRADPHRRLRLGASR